MCCGTDASWYSSVNDKYTLAIREFNEFLHTDTRIDLSMLPIGDGLLARKK